MLRLGPTNAIAFYGAPERQIRPPGDTVIRDAALYYNGRIAVIQAGNMPISVRLSPRVEQKLADYCVAHKITKSEAVKLALAQLFAQMPSSPDAYRASARFRGSDRRPGDVARNSKRLLRDHFRRKHALG